MGSVRRGVAVLAATGAAMGFGVGQASASVQWANDQWSWVCSSPIDNQCVHGSDGGVAWGQRTAELSGSLWDDDTNSSTYTKIYFDAFAGSTKVDSDFRTVNNREIPFRFDIGDPDLVGGIDRIRIQVCVHFPEWPYKECSEQDNELRD